MAQVDHRIRQCLERVMQLAEAIEPEQQAPELVFPTKHPLNGIEPFSKNGSVEQRLAATLGAFSTAGIGVDIGDHPAVEDGLAIRSAIIDAVQADDGSLKIKADKSGYARHQWQGFAQERRFITIAGR
jgi:hypothetical protein